MAVTIVDGELTVEPMRVDTFEHGLSLLDATEATAQSHSGFGSEYRRQLEVRSEACHCKARGSGGLLEIVPCTSRPPP